MISRSPSFSSPNAFATALRITSYPNGAIFVSDSQGTDSADCGNAKGTLACQTVAYACQRGVSPSMLSVAAGKYIETTGTAHSSFVNLSCTNSDGDGSCFAVNYTANMTLAQSLFVGCTGGTGGVGCVRCLDGSSNIVQSCDIWNASAIWNGGALCILSPPPYKGVLSVGNTSCTHCVVRDYQGGGFYLEYTNGSFVGCSFTHCLAGYEGGAVFVQNVTDSVFLENGKNDDIHVRSGYVTVSGSFTDRISSAASIKLDGWFGTVSGTMITADAYGMATCSAPFGVTDPINEIFAMPYTASKASTAIDGPEETNAYACVKPDECSEGYVAIKGRCVPQCEFTAQSKSESGSGSGSGSGSESVCASPCVPDFSLGYPLCRNQTVSEAPEDPEDGGEECTGAEDCLNTGWTCVADWCTAPTAKIPSDSGLHSYPLSKALMIMLVVLVYCCGW